MSVFSSTGRDDMTYYIEKIFTELVFGGKLIFFDVVNFWFVSFGVSN